MDDRELIYDWNEAGERWEKPAFRIQLDDETLRDGLQSPSVKSPPVEQKLEIIHLIEALGIDSADIGLPGAGPHVVRTVTRLAQEIVDSRMKLRPNCAARTVAADIVPIIESANAVCHGQMSGAATTKTVPGTPNGCSTVYATMNAR